MKEKIRAIVALLVGLVAIVGGLLMVNSDTVSCGGSEMSAGETCVTTSRRSGSSTERTMEEQRSENTTTGWVAFGIGVLLTAGGAFAVWAQFRTKPPQSAMGGQFAPQQPLPQGQPQPQHWQGTAPAGGAPQAAYSPQFQQQQYQQQQYQQQPYPQQSYPAAPQQGYPQGYPQQPYPQQPPAGPYQPGPH